MRIVSPMPELIREETLHGAVTLLMRFVEGAGALIIFAGALFAFLRFLSLAVQRKPHAFQVIRLQFGRFLALGLEFQLAADLLRTAVAPSWEQIGKLAAVAAIRTTLNYFLSREVREERSRLDTEEGAPRRPRIRPGRRAPDGVRPEVDA